MSIHEIKSEYGLWQLARSFCCVCCAAIAALMTQGCGLETDIPRDEIKPVIWKDRVIPLPKHMSITASKMATAGAIEFDMNEVPSDAFLKPVIRGLLAGWVMGGAETSSVSIRLQLIGTNAVASAHEKFLISVTNRDQAYVIWAEPRTNTAVMRLRLQAVTPLGLLYAARTLTQLVAPPAQVTPQTKLRIPRVTIRDWPDIAERGQVMSPVNAAWNARWKLNACMDKLCPGIDAGGQPCFSQIDQVSNSIVAAEMSGMKMLPYLGQMSLLARQVWKFQGNTNYPEFQSVVRIPDPGELWKPYIDFEGFYGLCMSNPKTRQLLTGWMMAMAKLVGNHHAELEIWLSEEAAPCSCKACNGNNQSVLETQAILQCFEKVKQQYPGMKLRICTSLGSYRDAQQSKPVFDLLPPEVGIVYSAITLPYGSSFEPLIYPLLEDHVRAGRFVGVVFQLTGNMHVIAPWTPLQFLQMRCQEFVDKKLSSVGAVVTPDEKWHEFNVMAFAEWSWNARGRTPVDFARSYATVTGICDPAFFAEWAVLAGRAGMELAESEFVNDTLMKPERMGKEFREYFEPVRLAKAAFRHKALNEGRQAEQLAGQTNVSSMALESMFTRAQLEAFDSLWISADYIKAPSLRAEEKETLLRELNRLDACAQRVCHCLVEWGGRHAPPREWHAGPAGTMPGLLRASDAAWEQAQKNSLKDPRPESRNQILGEWKLDDFAKDDPTFRFDITDKVARGGGSYHVAFSITNGYVPWVNTVAVYAVRSDGQTSMLARVEQARVATGTIRALFSEMRLKLPAVPAESKIILEVPLELDPRIRAAVKKHPDNDLCEGAIGWRRVYDPDEWEKQGLILP